MVQREKEWLWREERSDLYSSTWKIGDFVPVLFWLWEVTHAKESTCASMLVTWACQRAKMFLSLLGCVPLSLCCACVWKTTWEIGRLSGVSKFLQMSQKMTLIHKGTSFHWCWGQQVGSGTFTLPLAQTMTDMCIYDHFKHGKLHWAAEPSEHTWPASKGDPRWPFRLVKACFA